MKGEVEGMVEGKAEGRLVGSVVTGDFVGSELRVGCTVGAYLTNNYGP